MLGSGELDEEVMRELVLTMKSRDIHERTAATLTLLKLCRSKFSGSLVYLADYV